MNDWSPTDRQQRQFHEDGFFIVDRLLDDEEVELLGRIARRDFEDPSRTASRRDGQGGSIRLAVENELADDVYSAIVRSERIVDAMETLLGGEVYHYHHKMILKQPYTGGAWEWHQDYGYWYHNGCLLPLLASCLIAVDRATEENGCLQVLRGSHRMGRLDHVPIGDQTGADPERVRVAMDRFEKVSCELSPGSAVIFDCNLLHCSAQNKSPMPRWALICCYNAARNNPYKVSRHPQYSPLEKWPHSQIKAIGRQSLAASASDKAG